MSKSATYLTRSLPEDFVNFLAVLCVYYSSTSALTNQLSTVGRLELTGPNVLVDNIIDAAKEAQMLGLPTQPTTQFLREQFLPKGQAIRRTRLPARF